MLSTPVAIAQTLPGGLPDTTSARLTEPQTIADSLRERGVAQVIVEFARPEPAASGRRANSPEADADLTAAVAAAQDRILGRVLLSDGQAGAQGLAMAETAAGIQRMRFSPMFALSADATLLQRLAADPEVVRIHLNGLSEPLLNETLPLIGMPAAYAEGATGSGQVVAVLDTGVRLSHEHLSARVIEGACYNQVGADITSTSLCPGGVAAATTLQSGDDCTNPAWSGCGHGTHVASTAAGFVASPGAGIPPHGVARDARIMAVNVFSLFERSQCSSTLGSQYTHCVLAYTSDIILGLERVYERRAALNIAAVNMSLGGGTQSTACLLDPRRPIIQQLTNAGTAVVISAGNSSQLGAGAPGCIPEAVTVASSTKADLRSSFSNWSYLVDLVAPGSAIFAAYIDGESDNHYAPLNGTSMAAPHVAGAFAAIRTVHPTETVAEILGALAATGVPISQFINDSLTITRPRIQVDAALTYLETNSPTTTALTGPASSIEGDSVTLTVTVDAAVGTPAGSVILHRNGLDFATATLDQNGQASINVTSVRPLGVQEFTAVYQGGGGLRTSSSAPLAHAVTALNPPENDRFADRIAIPAPGTVTGTNVDAAGEPGQPTIADPSSTNAVWWSFTAPYDGELTIDTFGSGLVDTTMAVFTGAAVDALTLVAANDDASFLGGPSRVQFQAVHGTEYQIAVAGWNNQSGLITLNLGFVAQATPQTITFTAPDDQVFAPGAEVELVASASSGLPVSFTSQSLSVCSVTGSTATLQGGGTCTIRATQAGAGFFQPAPAVTRSFAVTPGAQTITFAQPPGQTYSPGATVALSALASSGLTVALASQTPGVCSVSGSTATLLGAGTCTIRATQGGYASYAAAAAVDRSFGVARASQVIIFTQPPGQTFAPGATMGLSASASSGLPVAFASQTGSICSVSGATVTLLAAGSCTIRATQGGDANFTAAPAVERSFAVAKAAQTITFAAPANQTFAPNATVPLSATASSGLAVSFASRTASVCSVSGTTATLLGAGTCTIRATQAGNANYNAADLLDRSFNVAQAGQTISFAGPADQIFTPGATVALSATSSSGLAVSLASQTASICSVSGSTATLLRVGTCTIRATQSGNANYNAAPAVDRSFQAILTGPAASFVGGGAVFAPTDACAPVLGAGLHAAKISYTPSELGGRPSGVSIAWPDGAEHLSIWGAMLPSGQFLGGAGRATWSRFVFYPTRPMIRVVSRQVTVPSGAGVPNAQELLLRLRVQNFAATPGCSVTIVATLRRGG